MLNLSFVSVLFPSFVAADDDDADDSKKILKNIHMFFFVENTRSIPVSFPRWFRYFRIRIHQHHRFIGPRPRSKPWDVRVIVVSWNHPKHLRSSVGWNPPVGTRGFGMVWGVVGVRLGWLAPVNQKTTNVLLIEVDVDELS